MLSNITGSPRTTLVGVLVGLFGAASLLGAHAGLPPSVTSACGVIATLTGLLLGVLGVDPRQPALLTPKSDEKGGPA